MDNLPTFKEKQFLRAEELNQIVTSINLAREEIKDLQTKLTQLSTKQIEDLEEDLETKLEQLNNKLSNLVNSSEKQIKDLETKLSNHVNLSEKQFNDLLETLEKHKLKQQEQDNIIAEQQKQINSIIQKQKLVFNERVVQPKPVSPKSVIQEQSIDLGNGITIEFVQISGGVFMMGGNSNNPNNQPKHQVNIREFWMGKTPITQNQWRQVARTFPRINNNLPEDPSYFKGNKDRPVESITWEQCQELCTRLTRKIRKTFRLPSEAEWEYACRAGTQTEYSFGNDESDLKTYGWYNNNSKETINVALKEPNPWGLYDMHGNVWEWCQDYWHDNYSNAPTDGSSWQDGNNTGRVIRGGAWNFTAEECRSSCRYKCSINSSNNRLYSLGLRIVLQT